VRRGIRGTLVRATGWATLASLSCFSIALLVGVGGFVVLGRQAPAPTVRIVRSTRATVSIVRAIAPTTALAAEPAAAAATTDLSAADALAAPASDHARAAAALATAAPVVSSRTAAVAAATAADAEATVTAAALVTVQSQAQELSVATPVLKPGQRVDVPVTFYYCQPGGPSAPAGDGGGFCGAMRDGSSVYSGAAACDYAYLGQLFKIVGDPTHRIYKCADTGSAIHGLHRDIWFNSSDDGWVWQHAVGRTATIEILP
jgi:3D (Asp-Asp-Asp) domain-containing protein